MKRLGRPPKVPRDPERDELRAQIRARLEPLLQELGDRIADLMAPRVLELRASAEVERAHFLSDAIDRELAGDDPETKDEEPDGRESEDADPEGKEASDASDDEPSNGDEDRAGVPAREARSGRDRLSVVAPAGQGDRDGADSGTSAPHDTPAPPPARRAPTVVGGKTCSKCHEQGHNARTCPKVRGVEVAVDDDDEAPPRTASSRERRRPLRADRGGRALASCSPLN